MSNADELKKAALEYHRLAPAGKIKVAPTKPMLTQRDLALAYSPGVAAACEAIVEDPNEVSTVTARGNLVIRATGRVLGVARCRRLQVEDGGQLSGRMEMLTDNNPPRMGVPAFPSAEPAEV